MDFMDFIKPYLQKVKVDRTLPVLARELEFGEAISDEEWAQMQAATKKAVGANLEIPFAFEVPEDFDESKARDAAAKYIENLFRDLLK